MTSPRDPHASADVLAAGIPLASADVAVVFVHGRGATAESMLAFADELPTDGAALLAPQAVGMQWYPYSFLAPIEDNEPWLSSALDLLGRTVDAADRDGPGRMKTVLVGFSQGACLMLECLARRPGRFGGVAGLAGGLIGPPGTTWESHGSLDGTPVFLGCGDRDPHIPEERVRETSDVLVGMGAEVAMRIYRGMDHTVNQNEIAETAKIIDRARTGVTR